MKKLLQIIFAFIISISFCPIYAEDTTYISKEEYFTKLKEEAKKYNVDIEITTYPEIITDEVLSDSIQNVHNIASSFKVSSIRFSNNSSKDISLASNMPVTANRYGYFDVTAGGFLSCTIKVTLNVTTNIDNHTVLHVNSKRTNQDGVAYGFNSWETYSISTKLNYPKTGFVGATVTGHCTFSAYGVTYSKDVSSYAKVQCY